MTRVGVAGASARAAVHSLARAGYSAWAVDQFADRDLTRVAECAVCHSENYPDAIPALASKFPPGPVLYTGGLENHPRVVAELASRRELWGNPADVLERVRDPFALFPALASAGFAVPRLIPHNDPCPPEGRWLRKPFRSGGGLGVRFARPAEPASPHHYFQKFIDGAPMSAIYLDRALIGVTEQLVGERWLHTTEFVYCGNIGPARATDRVTITLQNLSGALVDTFGAHGVFGADFVLADGVPHLVEVNPRYTAAVEVLEHATGAPMYRKGSPSGIARLTPPGPPSLKGRGKEGIDDSPPSAVREGSDSPLPFREGGPGGVGLPRGESFPHIGKAIYYAPRPFPFPHSGPWDADLAGPFDPWRLPGFADIPAPGATIERGHPVLTFFMTGDTPAEVRERLQLRAAELDRIFSEAHT